MMSIFTKHNNVLDDRYTDKRYLIQKHEASLKRYCANCTYEVDVSITQYVHQEEITPALENYVDIKDLVNNFDVHLTEKFFLCRNLVPTILEEDCMQCLVDDPYGEQAIPLRLFNYSCSKLAKLHLIPVGAILIIKDPWLTASTQLNEESYILRVDNANNVMIITDKILIECFPTVFWKEDIPIQYRHWSIGGGKLNTVQHWMNDGDVKMAEENLIAAVYSYNTALKIEPENVTALMKRATAFLNLRYFFRVLDDAKAVFTKDRNNFQAKIQYFKALCGLKKYDEAFHFLEDFEVSPGQRRILFNIIRQHQQQHETGKFDLSELYNRHQLYNEDLELADFNRPLQYDKQKNKTIHAKEDIVLGQLLLVEHAFSIVHTKREIGDVENCSYIVNMKGDSDRKNCHTYRLIEDFPTDLLAMEITEKLTFEPEWRSYFYEEYCPQHVDASLVAKEKIAGVSRKHSLNAWINEITGPAEGEHLTFVTGLWPSLARIRHSCWNANSFWIIIGNVLILRSLKAIQKGEEIRASFCDPPSQLSMEARMAMKKTDHPCDCKLCDSDRNATKETGETSQRHLENFDENQTNVEQIYNYITQLKKLSPQVVNVALIRPCHQLAETYFKMGKYREALNSFGEIYNLIQDSSLIYLVLEYSLRIASCFSSMHDKSEECSWIENVKSCSLRFYGEEDTWLLIKSRLDKTGIVCKSYNVPEAVSLSETKLDSLRLLLLAVIACGVIFISNYF